jgi:acyl carrier protein
MHCSLGSWLGFPDGAGKRRIEAVFAGRDPLGDEEFFQRFYAATGIKKEVAIGVRHAFLENLVFNMQRLIPTDSFREELNFVWKYDSLADVELICQIEKEFAVRISEAEAHTTFTMGDLIRLVDEKMKSKTPNQSPEPTP